MILYPTTALMLSSFVIGVFIPMLTALVTHITAPQWLRSGLNFGLSALAGILTTIAITDYHTLNDYLLAIAFAWLATMRSHYAGLTTPIAIATANFGIGKQSKVGTLDIPIPADEPALATPPVIPSVVDIPAASEVTPNTAIVPPININSTVDPAINPTSKHNTGG